MQVGPTLKKTCNQAISDRIDLKKVCVISLSCYVFLAVTFYFLAGDQLRFRSSIGNIQMPIPNYGTVEVVPGVQIEQSFTPMIQRFKQISITWGTFGRKNRGTVLVELYNLRDNSLVLSQKLDASEIKEGEVIPLVSDSYLEDLCGVPLMIRITSPDSTEGSAVSPMMRTNTSAGNGSHLYLNGKEVNGMLAFSAQGEDYIWTGLHYRAFSVTGGILLAMYLAYMLIRQKRGKKSLLVNALVAIKKYRFLIHQLVSRDFKTKYKRSILGVLWSFLNPLLMMMVQYYIFSTLFKTDIPYYPVYLLIGIIMFNFFAEACGMTLASIVGNAGLITKVYVPKYIYPLTRVLSSLINLLISLIPLFAVILLSGVTFTKAYLLFPFALFCLTLFSLGLGMLLAAGMVFFRDVQFLWGVFSMLWMYATPLFYPESIIPAQFKFILKINPLYYFIKFSRTCIIGGISPEPVVYVQSFLFAFVMLLIGAFVFRKTQDKFILYI